MNFLLFSFAVSENNITFALKVYEQPGKDCST